MASRAGQVSAACNAVNGDEVAATRGIKVLHADDTQRRDGSVRAPDTQESFSEKVQFALPEVAFSSAYRPGFSTYPEASTFQELYAVLAQHGSPGWISGEGTNVSPSSMPGEPTTLLRRETLVETTSTGFSATAFQDKMHRIQRELPAWVQQSGQHAQATRLTQKLAALMQDRKWQEADKVADELLSLMSQEQKK